MNRLLRVVTTKEAGTALLIVLALVVLLTGLSVAYLSRTTTDRQVAHSSFNQSNVDQLAQSAVDNIVGDLRQEITDPSASTPITLSNGRTIYVPTSNANMVPRQSPTPSAGASPAILNLIRRSVAADALPSPPGVRSRASDVNSTVDLSANGKSISLARWNSHYLVPKTNRLNDKSDPVTTGFLGPNYWAPDWVFVNNQGATVILAPNNSILGRYAYTIYDEAGLVDANVAGYPSGTDIYQYGRKGSLAFADLTVPPYPVPNPAGSPPIYQIDRLVGWRNYGTTQPDNSFPDPGSPPNQTQAFARNFRPPNTARAAWFYNFVVNNTSGFLSVRSDPNPTPYPWNYLNVTGDSGPATYPWNGRTDQMLLGRQELIAFRKATQFSPSALEYLSTFSRESAAGVPQWSPATPTAINPNFQTLLVTGSFTRNDGTIANGGDPYLNKRFLLERLNWLTYRGPSASRSIPSREPNSRTDPDWDMWLLTGRFGLTSTFLQQGTAANILKYFGLVWDTTNERWNYTSPSGGSLAGSIASLGTLTGAREPDFFELLQAGIINSSLGDAFSSDPALPSVHQQSKMLHVLTIGANLIAQSRTDSYPVRIACNVGGTTMEAIGMPRLPYLNGLAACPVAGTDRNSGVPLGGVNWFLIPNLWDPFRDSWDLTEANASSTLTPNYLRPPVRITVKGTASFGAANVSQSGSVDPSPTPGLMPFIGASTTAINASLPLLTGDNTFGRDGFLQAMRLGENDISGTVTLFNPPTQSPTGIAFQWNRIARPTNDNSTYRTDRFVVFRLSLPGVLISPLSLLGQKPVLILQPGFQVSLDYQSPNGQWYSYSFLQGNNAPNTWISSDPLRPSTLGLALSTSYSQYGVDPGPPPPPPSALPTIVNAGPPLIGNVTLWTVDALAKAPMLVKADPRSIRYNSMIGVVNVANPPLPFNSAGIIGPIWPSQYATPPPMLASQYPVPTPTPNANPATLGDNAPAGNAANLYNELIPTPTPTPPVPAVSLGDPWRPVIMNRPFRSVGEMAYAFRDQPFRTLSFSWSPISSNPDAGLLDLFSVNDYSDPTSMRAGVISLNSLQPAALAAVLGSTIEKEQTPRGGSPPAPTPWPMSAVEANNAANSLVSLTRTTPARNKAALATLIASETGLGPSVPKTQRESIARALGEADQTRTWNLFIDVIAQTGRFPPNATNLKNGFVVDSEQRYWVHVAIDRFTNQVIDKQIEVVNE